MRKSLLIAAVGTIQAVAGKLVEYNLTLEQTWIKLDGHGRAALTINKGTPGPVIEADEGDTLRINVANNMLVEAAMHWHGVFQKDSQWMDGVPGVTQWPIEPRSAFTYEIKLNGNQTGSYWYHGHFGAVLIDGQRGSMWIRPSPDRPRPYEMISSDKQEVKAMLAAEHKPRHIMLADWYADDVEVQAIQYRDTGVEPFCASSIIFNSKGRTRCFSGDDVEKYDAEHSRNSHGCLPPPLGWGTVNEPRECKETQTDMEIYQAEDGDEFLFMNFIHGGSHHSLRVSIDEHEMWIVAADGDFVQPRKVNAFDIGMAERISVLVKLDQAPRDYAIRATSTSVEQVIEGIGILRYPGVKDSASRDEGVMKVPDTKRHVDLVGRLLNDAKKVDEMADLAAFPARPPPATTDRTFRFAVNHTGPSSWVIASEPHQGFRQQLPPIMWNNDSMGPTSFQGMKNGSVVDIIFENHAHGIHPFHKHNHKVFIIGKGHNFFRWPDVATALKEAPENFNMVSPPLRDEWHLGGGRGEWTVVRYIIDYPALSMLHCHRIAHFMGGQQIILAEGIEALESPPDYIKGLTHAEFTPDFRFGPLD